MKNILISFAFALLAACGGSGDNTPAATVAPSGPTDRLKLVITTIDCAYAVQGFIGGQTGTPLSCGYITSSGDATIEDILVTRMGTSDDDSVRGLGLGLFSEKGDSGFRAAEAVNFKNGQLTLHPKMKIAAGSAVPFQILGDVAYRYNGIATGTTVGFGLGTVKVTYDTAKYAGVDVSFNSVSVQLHAIIDAKGLSISQEMWNYDYMQEVSGFTFMSARVRNLDPVPAQIYVPAINLGRSPGFDAGWFMANCSVSVKLKVTYDDGSYSLISAETVGWQIGFNTSFSIPVLGSVLVQVVGDTLTCDQWLAGAYIDFYLQGQQTWPTLKRPDMWIWGQPAHMNVPTFVSGKG